MRTAVPVVTRILLILSVALAYLAGCGDDGPTPAKSDAKDLTAFAFPTASGTINGQQIAVTVPAGTNVTALVATYTTTGASVTVAGIAQESGVTANNFTAPVSYTVTAEDGTTKSYTVTVTVASMSAKDITSFAFLDAPNAALTADVTGTITGTAIAITVPMGTNVTALVASFGTTGSSVTVSGVAQVSGMTANNFTSPVTYLVTAGDGTTQSYTVTVTAAASSAKDITSFAFLDTTNPALSADVTGTITGTAIALTVPTGTNVTALVATFATTGASVTVGGTAQVSGVTANDFTAPVTYLVTAGNGTTQSYTVTVTIASSAAKDITSFAFLDATNPALSADVTGTITGTAIALTVPAGTNVTALVATFATTGASVTVGGTAQASGVTANNFTSPVTYVVTAADTSTQSYTVTVTIAAASSAKDITSFAFLDSTNIALAADVTGTITGTSIALTVPFGTDVASLVATYTTTGATVHVGGTLQTNGVTSNNFTAPVTYFVTAADTSVQNYTVTVTIAPANLKDLTSFAFLDSTNTALTADVTGTITGTSIALTVPFGTDVTALVATYTTTGQDVIVGSTIQTSGATANNFTGPVTYVVRAADTSTQSYTVTVTVAPSPAKALTSFAFLDATNTALTADVTGTITGTAIALTVPAGTDVSALVATFTTTGANVAVGGTAQVSGVTANNFASPVTYVVTAADTSTQSYTVTVTIASSATIPNGTYTWGIWTCAGASTIDIKAFAMSIGIMEVQNRINGTTGFVDVIHTPTCTRTTAITNITYPSPGMVTYTSASSYTCSPGCAPATCTSGNQAVLTDTYSLTNNGAVGFTLTRILSAANVTGTLQAFAGCQAGNTETASQIKL